MRSKLLAAATILAVAIAGPPTSPALGGERTRALVWGDCPAVPPELERDPRQQCASLHLPLDYRRSSGPTISVAISRIATAKPTLRRGILLSNPGGPGGPGLDMPSRLAALLPAEVLDRYDLVGFDPRGVGHSTPVTCGMSVDTPLDLQVPFPAPDGSIDRNIAFGQQTARDCANLSGHLLPFITTANTARDMDGIRVALGERELSYLGYSYGTYLGAVYASLFPQHSDRFVLDSAIDPKRVWSDQWHTFSIGFTLRFPDFTAWAAARDATYQLGATQQAVSRLYDQITAQLDRAPVTLPDGFVVNGNVFRLVTFDRLYHDLNFPQLAAFWRLFTRPGAGPTAAAAARTPIGAAVEVPVDNFRAAQYAVVCDDAAWSRDVRMYQRNVAVDRRTFPRTAGFPANAWPCAFWANQPVEPPVRVTSNGPRNMLILQNLRDPATPWITGFGLRQALGRRAVMVSVDQGGHGVYGVTNAPCASQIATAFLSTGVLPEHDRLCPGQRPGAVTDQRSAPRPPAFPTPYGLRADGR
ncbi:alpha/beta hydrolase [Phytohabitans houttuyneae]|uniref:Alpha/beta hydrolase n=1 Tax=Phytohabitans houttuyneae TaxID=1076126 RepID=A0A6V8KJY9_9ACTN|nr:alpha/beta hydrolase [Phytohabitans houttuyneae]GFJ83730.1 alpha/beta hydrolase [Phytohabitans houttuyneae]